MNREGFISACKVFEMGQRQGREGGKEKRRGRRGRRKRNEAGEGGDLEEKGKEGGSPFRCAVQQSSGKRQRRWFARPPRQRVSTRKFSGAGTAGATGLRGHRKWCRQRSWRGGATRLKDKDSFTQGVTEGLAQTADLAGPRTEGF